MSETLLIIRNAFQGAIGFRDFSSLPAIDQSQSSQCASFETVEQAHFMLSHIFNRVSRWAFWVEPTAGIGPKPDENWMSMEKQRLQIQLTAWDAAFNPLVHALDSAGRLLLVHRIVLQVLFDKPCGGPDEMEWDKYTPRFQEAVQHAEAYMQATLGPPATNIDHDSSQRRPVFTVALDIVLPLFMCSAKCKQIVDGHKGNSKHAVATWSLAMTELTFVSTPVLVSDNV